MGVAWRSFQRIQLHRGKRTTGLTLAWIIKKKREESMRIRKEWIKDKLKLFKRVRSPTIVSPRLVCYSLATKRYGSRGRNQLTLLNRVEVWFKIRFKWVVLRSHHLYWVLKLLTQPTLTRPNLWWLNKTHPQRNNLNLNGHISSTRLNSSLRAALKNGKIGIHALQSKSRDHRLPLPNKSV